MPYAPDLGALLFTMIRAFAQLLVILFTVRAGAQELVCLLPPELEGGMLSLAVARGSDHVLLDSARIPSSGEVRFTGPFEGPGFYRVAISASDQADIILVPGEQQVRIRFEAAPLQEHIHVLLSDENKRLWEYKRVSREAQAVQVLAREHRSRTSATDIVRARQLDSMEHQAQRMQQDHLDRLIAAAPGSYFARVVSCSRALDRVQGDGPMAVAGVFDLSDRGLLHSSGYDRAVMRFLEEINAVSEVQFVNAADTLVRLASGDTLCADHMVDLLLRIFVSYGPDVAAQHLVDRYVATGERHISSSTRSEVGDLLRVSMGTKGASFQLPLSTGDMVSSDSVVRAHSHTVLFFYSSTCEHCHLQMPPLVQAYPQLEAEGIAVLGIALDADAEEMRKTIQEEGIPWPCGSELNGWGSAIAKSYAVKATPSFVVLDRDGRIVAKPLNAIDLLQQADQGFR